MQDQRVPLSPALVVKRAGGALLLFWLVLTLTFALVRLAPGDPATLLVPPSASAADAARLRTELGLDRPVAVQYARWAAGMLRGDLGESVSRNLPVRTVLAEVLPVSLWLGGSSLLLTFLVAVPLGLWQGAYRGRRRDHVATVIATAVAAAPTYWLALALIAVFTYGASMWGLPAALRLPAFGLRSPGLALEGFAAIQDVLRHSILPVGILAAVGAAGVSRYVRGSAVEVIGADFVRAARARGASPIRVHLRHVLRNILPPVVTLFALALPGVVAGSVFVESVFAWPGMGRTMLGAIAARDYPLVMGCAAVYGALVIAANLLADLALPLLDPRRRG